MENSGMWTVAVVVHATMERSSALNKCVQSTCPALGVTSWNILLENAALNASEVKTIKWQYLHDAKNNFNFQRKEFAQFLEIHITAVLMAEYSISRCESFLISYDFKFIFRDPVLKFKNYFRARVNTCWPQTAKERRFLYGWEMMPENQEHFLGQGQ
jgi:hypothetical protein